MKRLVVLISGRGRNLKALLDAVSDGRIDAQLAAVVSNRADAPGLAYARDAGVPALVVAHAGYRERSAFDAALADAIRALEPDIVALAGFMRVLGAEFVREFEGRLLNIHPSLLPKHRGLDTHARARAAGDTEHGATVHYVTEELDGGPSVIQGRFSVMAQDDVQSLAERALLEVELKIYPQAVAWMARGELEYRLGRVLFRGHELHEPLSLHDLEPAFR